MRCAGAGGEPDLPGLNSISLLMGSMEKPTRPTDGLGGAAAMTVMAAGQRGDTGRMSASELIASLVKSRGAVSLLLMGLRGATLTTKFVFTVYVARFIGLDILGIYGLIAGLAVMVPVAIGFGLIGSVSRDAVTLPLPDLASVLRRYGSIQGAFYGTALVLALASATFCDCWALAVAVVLIVALEQANDDLFTVFNSLRRPALANIVMFVRAAGWMLAYIALSFFHPSLRTLPVMLTFWIAGCVAALLCYAVVLRHWPWREATIEAPPLRWLAQQVRTSRILYVNNIANSVGQYVPQYLVSLFMGLDLTGVYVLFWSISNALNNLITTGMIQPLWPDLVAAYRGEDETYWKKFRALVIETSLAAIGLALVVGVLAQIALPYLQRPLATQFVPALWVMLVGFVLRNTYEVQGIVFFTRSRDDLTLVSGLAVFTVTALANLALVPPFSLYGAAVAIVVAYLTGLLVRLYLIERKCR